MEDRHTRFNITKGLVTITADKFEQLVRGAVMADTAKRLLMAKGTNYIDSSDIRIVLGIDTAAPIQTKGEFDE